MAWPQPDRSKEHLVRCYANRGQEYRVGFDAAGKMTMVEVLIRTMNRNRSYWRKVWSAEDGREMSVTAVCAGRAALAVMRRPST